MHLLIRSTLLALSLSLAAPAWAAPSTPSTASEAKTRAKRAKKEIGPSKEKAAFDTARAGLIYAATSCLGKAPRCNQELLADWEGRFLQACNACTGMDECRDEVKTIREGQPTKDFSPCK